MTPPEELPSSQSGDGVAPKTDQDCTLPAVVNEGSNQELKDRMNIYDDIRNRQRALKDQEPIVPPVKGLIHETPPPPFGEQSESGHEQIVPSSLANEGETETERKLDEVNSTTLCSQCGMRCKQI